MLPQIPQSANRLIQDASGQVSTFPFPPNIAADLPKELRKQIFQWMLQKYIWPQIQERMPFERTWEKLYHMARATWKYDELGVSESSRLAQARQAKEMEGNVSPNRRVDIADTIIFDAVDRLTNLNHFISFKEQMPMRYQLPPEMEFPHENDVYSPSAALIKAANGWLRFNVQNSHYARKHWMTARHHYTYGVSFAQAEFEQRIELVDRRQPDRTFKKVPELTKVGVTFEPISIRKLWINYRLSPYNMDHQPCPFFFEEMPRFVVQSNVYQPMLNDFGFSNLDSLPTGQYLFGSAETAALEKIYQENTDNAMSLTSLTPPELGVELLWTFYPMLPLQQLQKVNEETGQPEMVWDFDADGTKGYPLQRYITQAFGNNLCSGNVEIVRMQRNYYPHDSLPIFGSAHMPDLDSGAYPLAIGQVLENHYIQIVRALNQFLENKDLANDPPTKIMFNSPAMAHDLNKKGAKIPVNSLQDYERADISDNTNTTPQFIESIRDQAKTSSKAVDAILGKAMGSRTSATEASNVFQTAMSGVTTDINLFNFDISGSYADRVWEYAGLWIDPDILALITGQYGFQIKAEHMSIRLGVNCDIGSAYIESITRQSNIRYLLEFGRDNPAINSAELLRMLLTEWKFANIDRIVNDSGVDDEIKTATEQACQTYMGEFVMVDPDQNHQIGLKVKVSFLKDRTSVWNTNPAYVVNGPRIVEQIKTHQFYIQLQQMQAMVAMQQQQQGGFPGQTGMTPEQEGGLQRLQSQNPPATAGQAAQGQN